MKPVRFSNRTETDLVYETIDYLERRGCYVWRNNTGRRGGVRFGKRGSPDVIGIRPDGRFIGVECKTPEGKLSVPQRVFHLLARQNRAVIIVAHSIEELHEQYERIAS